MRKKKRNSSISHHTNKKKGHIVAGQTVRLAVLRPVLFPPKFLVTAETAEVVKVPVLILCTRVLTTQNQLYVYHREIHLREIVHFYTSKKPTFPVC